MTFIPQPVTIKNAEFFVEGEKRLGQYTIFILQHSSGGWMPAVMAMDGLVTNYRLMLRPTRKKYTPATLPGHYIKHVELTTRGSYHCVMLVLITGHELYLMPGTGKLDDLYDDLCTMKVPRPKFAFDDTVARRDIERLINFFRDAVP